MKTPIWVHQVATSYAQSALGFDDSKLPFSEVWGKVADGLNFMSTWDRHGAAIDGLTDVVQRERMHEADGGREWKPWVVVRGQQPGLTGNAYVQKEGELGGRIAAAGAGAGERPILILDLEPWYHGGATPQFWRGDLMGGRQDQYVDDYLAAFARTAPDGELWLSVDARGEHTDNVAIARWWASERVTRVLPQVYWTDFRTNPAPALEAAHRHLQARGIPASAVAPVLPGNASPADLTSGIRRTHELGMGSPSIWQRLNLSPAAAAALEELEDPWATTPGVDLEEVRQHVAAAAEAVDEAEHRLAAARRDLETARAQLGG